MQQLTLRVFRQMFESRVVCWELWQKTVHEVGLLYGQISARCACWMSTSEYLTCIAIVRRGQCQCGL